MLSSGQMVLLVAAVITSGIVAGVVFHLLENKRKETNFPMVDFSDNYVAPKMKNSDIAVDDIIENFKLLN